jgi:hypothetical protein
MVRPKDSGRAGLCSAGRDRWLVVTLLAASACWSDPAPAQQPVADDASTPGSADAERVACLLPAEIDRFGRQLTIVGARQKIETSRADCQARGGEVIDGGRPAKESTESGR